MYDGSSATAPLLNTICGYSLPNTIHSSGQDLWFRFALARDTTTPAGQGSRRNRYLRGAYDMTYTSSSLGQGNVHCIQCD